MSVLRKKGIRLFGSVLFVFALGACGDDDGGDGDPDAGGDGGMAGMDASAGRGGSGGSSGSGGTGGGGTGGGDAGEPYQCEESGSTPEPGGDADEGEACCSGLGVCTANVSGPGTGAYGLDDCRAGEDLKCEPLDPASGDDGGVDDEDGGTAGLLATCRATVSSGDDDYEGRCIPSCFLTGDPATANLGQSTCAASEKCVPCYSPITGESTGACNRAGDAPVDPAPSAFAACGDGDTGYCVPGGAAGGASLPQLTCDDGEVCAPKSAVLDPNSCFARCDSLFGPGACLPSFVVGDQASVLGMESCAEGEICVPCVHPIEMTRTGACD